MTIRYLKTAASIALVATLAACSDQVNGDNIFGGELGVTPPPPPPPPVISTFQVTVSNLTNAQPMSPVAVFTHGMGFRVFEIGAPASTALEVMAEGGDNADLIAEANNDAVVLTTVGGGGPIPPGQNEVLSFEIEENDLADAYVTISTMLVNTNDAFTGVNGVALEGLTVGDVVSMRGVVYDAGTEADDEAAIYIPGPAGGGEGFNAARDDQVDAVTMHSGVVTMHDGLATSALTGQHKFDNPAIQVRIERIE